MDYLVPAKYGEAEYIEKRSRFIGQVWPAASEDQAKRLITETKAKYYDARHNCWCYCIRDGAIRYADDGEPQGTAGQPMLEVFRRGGIDNVLCVVTRYFGGILLGAGGLTRAYAHAAKLALEAAGIAEMRLWKCLSIRSSYPLHERIKKEIDAHGGVTENTDYGTDVIISALFPEHMICSFEKRLVDISAGSVTGTRTGDKHIAAPVK